MICGHTCISRRANLEGIDSTAGWWLQLQGVKRDSVLVGRGHQALADILLSDGDLGFELMSRGEGFDHCCSEMVAERSVPLLQLRHRPSEIS